MDQAQGLLFVSESSNHRILVFELDARGAPTDQGAAFVLGQPDLTSSAPPLAPPAPQLLRLEVTPGVAALAKGRTRLFTAPGTYGDGAVRDLSDNSTHDLTGRGPRPPAPTPATPSTWRATGPPSCG